MGYCSHQAFLSSNPAAGRCNRGRNQYSADWRFSTLLRDHRHSYLFQHGCDLFERGIHIQIQSHVAIVIIEHEYSSGDGVIVPKWDVTRFNQTTSRLRIFQDHIIQRQIDSLSVAAVHFLFSRSLISTYSYRVTDIGDGRIIRQVKLDFLVCIFRKHTSAFHGNTKPNCVSPQCSRTNTALIQIVIPRILDATLGWNPQF